MTLTYVMPKRQRRPFKVGDIVEVLDREGVVISEQRIVRAGPKRARTACGRSWEQRTGFWCGEKPWPFPSIRIKRKVRADG